MLHVLSGVGMPAKGFAILMKTILWEYVLDVHVTSCTVFVKRA